MRHYLIKYMLICILNLDISIHHMSFKSPHAGYGGILTKNLKIDSA